MKCHRICLAANAESEFHVIYAVAVSFETFICCDFMIVSWFILKQKSKKGKTDARGLWTLISIRYCFFFLANVLSMPMTTMAQATSMPPITMPWCARKHSPKSHICNLPQSRKLGQFGGMCVEAARLATHPNISISCPPTICVDVGVWLCSAFRQTSTRCWAGR